MKRSQKGFTLIELLVVIAIIGILSSVVLASLNTARSKGKDGAIKVNLNTIRSEIELYYIDGENYGTAAAAAESVCNDTVDDQPFETVENISRALAVSETQSGNEAVCAIGPEGSSWAVSVPLASDPLTSWCVNDVGGGGEGTATGGGGSAAVCSS